MHSQLEECMKLINRAFVLAASAALSMSATACVVEDASEDDAATSQTQQPAPTTQPVQQPVPQTPDLRLEVDLAQRKLNVFRNDQQVASHPVAVGSKEWPTPTGEWTIGQVVFNPRWVPPKEESWAKDEKIAEPGDPDNPLGVVQLVYNPPNTIHGTNEPNSLGKAVSHGSIRVSNEVGVELAKQIMQAGGANKDDAFVQNALANKTQRVDVDIPNPVPIRVF
jgi:lipoprotein-anchoring transpeptidase ErfK/SrfK